MQADETPRRPYVGYVRGGFEIPVSEALAAAGFNVWCGTVRVQRFPSKASRKGSRIAEEIQPALPNYIRLDLDGQEFYTAHDGPLYHPLTGKNLRRYLHSTMMAMSRLGAAEFARFQKRVEQMGVIQQLKPGALIELLDGPLKGQLVSFKAIADNGHEIEFAADFMGRQIKGTAPAQSIRCVE